MRRWLIFMLLVLLVRPGAAQQTKPTTSPASDPSTPAGALRALAIALRDGDVDAIRRAFITHSADEEKMVSAVADMSAALADLHRAAIKAYGNDQAVKVTGDTEASTSEALSRIDSADITVEGDTALIRYKDDQSSPALLKKEKGVWKIPTSELGKPVDAAALRQRLAELSAQTRAVREITDQIGEGKFPTPEKAAEAWHTKMFEVPTSQPSHQT